MLDSPTVLSTNEQINSQPMSPLAIQPSSPIKLVSSPPTNFNRNISVVDLNNKDSSSYLLLMMQQQQLKQQQQTNNKSVNPLALNSQIFPMSPYSSTPSSITTSPTMVSPQSPMSMSPTSNYYSTSNNNNRFFKIVNLSTPNSNTKPVMSQENFSQQQQQQQQQPQQQLTCNKLTSTSPNSTYALPISVTTSSTNNNINLNTTTTNLNDSIKSPEDLLADSQEQLTKLKETVSNTTNQVTNTTNVFSSTSVASMTNNGTANTTTTPTTTTNPTSTSTNKPMSTTSDGETEEEENDILEESPDGRWIKRTDRLTQGDVPGIDKAFLAMDTEYGIEVAWNEIFLSDCKKFKNQEEEIKIDLVFDNLIGLNHPNIVKFHKHWIDKNKRIIFITEYMSSGSLKSFLRKAKRTNQPIKKQTWKRWCIQLLTALHYLHNCDPPIIHGNLSCDTVLIQHNGLIKIGSIAPDIVNQHVKTVFNSSTFYKNLHFIAPELYDIYPINNANNSASETANPSSNLTVPNTHTHHSKNSSSSVDIYAFGMVALEMFNLELGGNGDTHTVTPELIKQSIECLDEKQRDFINCCLQTDPLKRPTAKELLFHPLLFEVPSLRLLAAHRIIQHQNESRETCDPDFRRDPDFVIATTNRYYKEPSSQLNESSPASPTPSLSNSSNSIASNSSSTTNLSTQTSKHYNFKYSELSHFEPNKFLEDVKNGVYPLTAFGLNQFKANKHKHSISEQVDTTRSLLSVNNEMNSLVRPPVSPANTSVSGTSTSVANISNNYSSQSSSSSASPTQSLTSQVNIQQQVESNTNINNTNELLLESDKTMNIDNELVNSFNNQSNTPTPQQQTIQFINTDNNSKVLYSSPSASPPPLNGSSRIQSPITTLTNTNGAITNILPSSITTQSSPTPNQQQIFNNSSNFNDKPSETQLNEAYLNVEKRHAEKIEFFIKIIDKFTSYKLTLNITFDDKTSRFLESPINNSDTAVKLTEELINFGLVNENDRERLNATIQDALALRDLNEN